MRHDRVLLSRGGWQALLDGAPALRRDPEVARWAAAGWPLVRRRRLPGESAEAVTLGMPLPPEAGKRRLAVTVPPGAVATHLPALGLAEVVGAAPAGWRPTLEACLAAAARHGSTLQVFGSLAWAAITGRAYLTPASDLDLMLRLVPTVDPGPLLAALGDVARHAPMRLDGEIVRPDGAALAWGETSRPEALVKHEDGACLMAPAAFFAGAAP